MHTPAAFISYAHLDDHAYGGRITRLRERLEGMSGSAIGRKFRIFQDRNDIGWGQHFPSRLEEGLNEALFLIPILTPAYFNSDACRAELETFLELESHSGRNDRILPLYFLDAPVFDHRHTELAAKLRERQYRDWRQLVVDPLSSVKAGRALHSLAKEIAVAIHRMQPHPLTPAPAPAVVPPPPVVLGLEPRTQGFGSPGPAQVAEVSRSKLGPRVKPEDDNKNSRGESAEERRVDGPMILARGADEIRSRPNLDAKRRAEEQRRGAQEYRQHRWNRQTEGDLRAGTPFKDLDEPWCPEMVVIPAGSFLMGSPEDEEGRDSDEGPQHEVTFSRPFALGRYPVTFAEYDSFCDRTGRAKPDDHGAWGRGRRPVINVSWDDAEAYCKWLSEMTRQPYGLPTEAEWEYACRASTTTPFWTGATINTDQANYDGNSTYGSGEKGQYREQTTPVDTFPANLWGLHDMHGNVWEWCEDLWHDSYERAPSDGSAWLAGRWSDERVARGGSWNYPSEVLRSAFRGRCSTGNRNVNLGFRVARKLHAP
jgi:formylglycine-generating enzyme required for sulfatase activity